MISRSLLRQPLACRVPLSPRRAPTWNIATTATRRPAPYPSLRGYSSAVENNSTSESQTSSTNKDTTEATEQPAEDATKAQLEAKDTEIREMKDKYLRAVADFRNLQDRTARDMATARDFAITRFAKDLIDSVDNLDRALLAVPQASLAPDSTNKDLKDLHGGLKMTESILMQTLAKHGLVRFDPSENGEKFDPNLHEATFMTKMEGKDDGTVFNTIQKGFTLNGRVVRAAKVGVVKNS